MKSLKIILITVEIATLIGIAFLAFTETEVEEARFFRSMFLTILPLFAIVVQSEQQEIDWDEDESDSYVQSV